MSDHLLSARLAPIAKDLAKISCTRQPGWTQWEVRSPAPRRCNLPICGSLARVKAALHGANLDCGGQIESIPYC